MSPPPAPPPSNALEFDLDPEDFVETAERRSSLRMESVAVAVTATAEDAEATTAFAGNSRARLEAALESLGPSRLPAEERARPKYAAALVDFDDAETSFLAPKSLEMPVATSWDAQDAPTNDLGEPQALRRPLRAVPLSVPAPANAPRSLRFAAPRPEFDDLPTRVGESLERAESPDRAANYRVVSPDFDDIPTKFESERAAVERANSLREPPVDEDDLTATAPRASAAQLQAASLSAPPPSLRRPSIRPSRAAEPVSLARPSMPAPVPPPHSVRPPPAPPIAPPHSVRPPPRSPFASAPPPKRQTLAPPIPPVSAMRASAPPPPPPAFSRPAPPAEEPMTGALDMAAIAEQRQNLPRSAPPPPYSHVNVEIAPHSVHSTLKSAPLPPPGELYTPPPPMHSAGNLPPAPHSLPAATYSGSALVPPAQASGYLPGYADPAGYVPPGYVPAPAAPVEAPLGSAQRVRIVAITVLVVIALALFAKSFVTPVEAPRVGSGASPTTEPVKAVEKPVVVPVVPSVTAAPLSIDSLPLAGSAQPAATAKPTPAVKSTATPVVKPPVATPTVKPPVTTPTVKPNTGKKPAAGSILNDAL